MSSREVVWVGDAAVELHRVEPVGGAVSGRVVFFHGWGLGPRAYSASVGQLAQHGFDVVMPAMPGFGGSSHVPGRHDVDSIVPAVAEHLGDALGQAGIGDRLLVGHSLGAGVAALVADAGFDTPGVVMLSPIGGDSGVLSWVRAAASLSGEVPHSTVERAREAVPSFVRSLPRVLATGVAAKRINLSPAVSRLASRSQVSVVTAEEDRVTPSGRLLSIPGVRYRRVPGTHGWVLSDGAEVANEVLLHCRDFQH